MKIRYGVLVMLTAIFVSYWFVDGRACRYRYEDCGDYISDHYMPLVRTMETFNTILTNKRIGYGLVVAYVYNLTDAQQETIKSTDGQEVYSERYQQINRTYKMIEKFVAEHDSRFDAAGDRGVKFVGINLQHGDMQKMLKKYDLTAQSETLLFFRNGELSGKQEFSAELSHSDLEAFLQKVKFDDFLDDETQRYEREENRERRNRRRYRRYYSGYGGPYLGFGYGYRPYYGYWGAGYPGYYHGYRPYGGFGFGW